jgi:hypothetical protein
MLAAARLVGRFALATLLMITHASGAFAHDFAVPAVTGLSGTLNTELDYQLLLNAPHQALGTISVNAGFGHTGRVQALGAPYFINVSPVINFGKGFGDLPESIFWLKPFAITGMVSFAFPTKTQSAGLRSANNFNFGFAF